jgi:hypothetical protein
MRRFTDAGATMPQAQIARDTQIAVANFTLRVSTPLYWHDRLARFPKKLIGATCFVLRFDERLVGVTAAHVVDQYEQARGQVPTLVCQLRLAPFALHDAIIDIDSDLERFIC